MCIACEMAFYLVLEDGLAPSTGTGSHDPKPADAAPRFACDMPEDVAPIPAALPISDEYKP
jgi:hypothetical protein